jgi:hypothetical protein
LFDDSATNDSAPEEETAEESSFSRFITDLADDEMILEKPADEAPKAKGFLSASLFLKTTNTQLLPKVINEIHSMSGRYACLPFEQIASQIECVEDLWSMGAVTITLSDVLNITPSQRKIVESYLERSQSLSDLGPELNEIPLFLISSGSSFRNLVQREILEPSFTEQIEACILEVDRLPLSTTMLRTTLELFLEPGAIL